MAIAAAEAERICATVGPRLYGVAVAKTGRPAEAEELAQIGVIRLVRAKARGQKIDDEVAWGARVVLNEVTHQARRSEREVLSGEAPDQSDVSRVPEAVVLDRESLAVKVFLELKEKDRVNVAMGEVLRFTDSQMARATGKKPGAMRMAVMRSLDEFSTNYVWQQTGIGPITAACRDAYARMPRWSKNRLDPKRTAKLDAHVAECERCAQARALFQDNIKQGLTALFPLMGDDRFQQHLRQKAVAVLLEEQKRSPFGTWLRLWQRRQRWATAIALVLLLLLVLFVPHSPRISIKAQLVGVEPTTLPTPSALIQPSPSPLPSPSPSPPPSPPPPPAAAAQAIPCPAAKTQAYAYIHNGEAYLCSASGVVPRQLTSTGGRLDAYWVSPDGTRLAYKIPTSPPNIAGDVHVISLATTAQLWDLGANVDFFSFSPDGHSWAAGNLVVQNGVLTGVQVLHASFPAKASAAQSFTVPKSEGETGTPPQPVQFDWRDYQDQGGLGLFAVLSPEGGVIWQPDGIYVNVVYNDLYDTSGNHLNTFPESTTFDDRMEGFPANSAFQHDIPGAEITCTWNGRTVSLYQPDLGGRPNQMSVSSDGRTGLVSVHDGGFKMDVVEVLADGATKYLSHDGYTLLPRWIP